MNRLARRAATMLAATLTCAAVLPAATAQATHILSPCDNVDATAPHILYVPADFGILGVFEVKLQLGQDNHVKWTHGPAGNYLVGADLQTISLAENTAVCVVTPLGGAMVAVNVVGLGVQVCRIYPGAPYTLDCVIS